MVRRLTFLRKEAKGITRRGYQKYDGDPAKDTLADLRKQAVGFIGDDDRFEDPGDAEAYVHLHIEETFSVEELIGEEPQQGGAKRQDKPIHVWSEAYIIEASQASQAPALPPRAKTISLNVKRTPKGLGGKDKVYQIKELELESMTLEALRTGLQGKGYILPDDRFVDQGVPKTKEEESNLTVSDILIKEDGEGKTVYNIDVYSKTAAADVLEDDQWQEHTPKVQSSDFKVNLEVPKLADYTPTKDHTTDAGTGFPSTTVPITQEKARTFSQLEKSEQVSLLKACRLYPRKGAKATCAALRMADQIEFCGTNIIKCKQIQLLESHVVREDRVSVSYSEEVSKWHSYLVEASKLGASVPLTFDMTAGGGHSQTDQGFSKGVTVYLSKVLALPKAEVLLEDVEVSSIFVDAVKKAVEKKSGYELMRVLHTHGHFVATHFVLGGKVICTSSKVLKEHWKRAQLGWSFNAQAAGAFKAQGVPVELGGGSSAQSEQSSEDTTIDQHYELMVRTIGGFGEGSSSQTDKLADNWLVTVATQPQTWRVIGFKDADLKPTLAYLDESLENEAKAILREYFESQLVLKKSEAVGGGGGKDWDDRGHVKFQNKVAACNIMYDQNIDSIRFEYQDRSTRKQSAGDWHGESREKEHPFTVGPKDEIVAIEVGWDKTIDHVLIHTKNDDNQGNVMGRAKGARYTHTFCEPRIRGFHGRSGHFLDALGVYYYDLSKDLNGIHRSALLSLERYLFE